MSDPKMIKEIMEAVSIPASLSATVINRVPVLMSEFSGRLWRNRVSVTS
jgi:hypothetical protein